MKKIIVAVLIICLFSFAYAATYRKIFKITNADQSTFNSSDSAGAAVRMWNYYTDPTGGTKTLSGSLTEIGSGLWYYDFDPDSSGYYLLQSYTTASASWTDIAGYAPIYITNEAPLYGDVDETVTGTWTFSGNTTFSGKISTADTVNAKYFKIDGVEVTSTPAELNLLDGATTTHHLKYQERGYATQTNITAGTTTLSGYCGGAYEISANGGQVIINLPAAGGGNSTMFLSFWANNVDNTITITSAAGDSIYLITGDSTWVYSNNLYMKDVNSSVILCPTSPDTWSIIGGGHGIDLKD